MKFSTKKINNKTFYVSVLMVLLIAFSISIITPVLADEAGKSGDTSGTSFSLKNPLKVDSIGGLVQNFIEIFSYIAILFAVLLLIYVGLRFILVRGDSAELSKLKDWLLWIVVGVAVIIGARLIIQVVINTLSLTGTVDERTIQSVQKAVNGK